MRTVAEALQQQLIASQEALKLAQAEHRQPVARQQQAEVQQLQQRIQQLSQRLEKAEEAHMRALAEGRATSDDLSIMRSIVALASSSTHYPGKCVASSRS